MLQGVVSEDKHSPGAELTVFQQKNCAQHICRLRATTNNKMMNVFQQSAVPTQWMASEDAAIWQAITTLEASPQIGKQTMLLLLAQQIPARSLMQISERFEHFSNVMRFMYKTAELVNHHTKEQQLLEASAQQCSPSLLVPSDKEDFFDMQDMLQCDDISEYNPNNNKLVDENALIQQSFESVSSPQEAIAHALNIKPGAPVMPSSESKPTEEEVLISSWLCRPDEPKEGLDLHLWEQLLQISEKFSKVNKPQDLLMVKSILRSKDAQIVNNGRKSTTPPRQLNNSEQFTKPKSKKVAPKRKQASSVEPKQAKQVKKETKKVAAPVPAVEPVVVYSSSAAQQHHQQNGISAEQFIQQHLSSFQPCQQQQQPHIHMIRQLMQSNVITVAGGQNPAKGNVSAEVVYNTTEYFNEASWSDGL